MNKRTLLFGLAAFLGASPAFAEPVSIGGLHWGAGDIPDMMEALEANGYSCKENTTGYPDYSARDYTCEKGDRNVHFDEHDDNPVITFGCDVFNGCSRDFRDVAEQLDDRFGMERMELVPSYEGISHFEGRGPEGQRIKVYESLDGNGTSMIRIEKGAYGEQGIDFD